ncbi:enoyl-CoA hydratase-related protein, partial [Pseudomonas aeruginosa]|uniref:enoyl-CoA hydratase-related protein n=1 Tax=Pseudomonas aeruginosa TaxID=287 RepID=UPI0024AF6F7B
GADADGTRTRACGGRREEARPAPHLRVALVEGAVLGAGFGLACVSDVAIAAADAQFGLPEPSLGILPAQIAPFVVRLIGLAQARRLA